MAEANDPLGWNDEDAYWRANYRTRPYATGGQAYESYEPGYRYGYEAANRYRDRTWSDVESDLSTEWESYDRRGESTWEQVKDAVRDAWDRITGNRTARAGR
jgi:hypothetical protein